MSSSSEFADLVFRPHSIVIVGASDNPHKIGGRPLLYLKRFGYGGRVYAVNPRRTQVQGVDCFPTIAALPETPELAVIVTPADAAPEAIDACASRGVRAAIVMSSGFGETQETDAIERERSMIDRARSAGMRVIGPNTQGLAAFHTGVVASFSTLFMELTPADGPVAIVSQSGIMSVVPLGLLHRAGIGVRYALASGNEADVSAADLAIAALGDPHVRLLLLYLESIRDPERLAHAARLARERDIPIVAVKAGRSARGQTAARSHTAALASDNRIVDAFFRHHGIWRVHDIHDLVRAAPLYLRGWRPAERSLIVVSNSGASCVLAADTAQDLGLPLAELDASTVVALRAATPPFAAVTNPIDLTAQLMHDSALLGRALDVLGNDRSTDLVAVDLPVSGDGYDLDQLSRDVARFEARHHQAVVVSTPHGPTAAAFRTAGLPVFDNPTDALHALDQLAAHSALLRMRHLTAHPISRVHAAEVRPPAQAPRLLLSEADSLSRLHAYGLPIVSYRLCRHDDELRDAFEALGPRVVVKACSPDVPHKARLGLVSLDVSSVETGLALLHEYRAAVQSEGLRFDGVIVQPMVRARHECAVGAIRDRAFGPLVMLGSGGVEVEALDDAMLLMAPVAEDEARDVLRSWRRAAPRNRGVDDDALESLVQIALGIGRLIADAGAILSIDANPVLILSNGSGALIVDALIEIEAAPGDPAL